jgi:uncharacterized protein with GYD domain
MTKYAFFFSYSSESWARMIRAPGDRTAAVRQVLASQGGSLDCIYWMSGSHDGIAIADLPDSVSAAAVSIAVASTGAIAHSQTHVLLTQEELGQALQQAGATVRAFQPPGREA